MFTETNLEKVQIPSTLRVLEVSTFAKCSNLKMVYFSEGLERIEIGVFLGSGLETVRFPKSLKTLAQASFAKCEALTAVTVNEGLEVLGTDEYDTDGEMRHGVFGYSAVQDVRLPATLKRIEYSAFEGCKKLRELALPDGLEFIGKRCFYESGIERM